MILFMKLYLMAAFDAAGATMAKGQQRHEQPLRIKACSAWRCRRKNCNDLFRRHFKQLHIKNQRAVRLNHIA
jgi:hypothetical protein